MLHRVADEDARLHSDEGDMPARVIEEVQFQRRMGVAQMASLASQARSVISGRGSVIDDPSFDGGGSVMGGSVLDDAMAPDNQVFGDMKQPEPAHDQQ